MKRVVAAAITVILMGLIFWSSVRRPEVNDRDGSRSSAAGRADAQTNDSALSASPAEVRVRALIDSASKGDVTAYLASFGGTLRERIERSAAERGREAFAAELREASRARKSHAVFAAEPDGDSAARVTVETVYPDRNERRTYLVEKIADLWLVTEAETVQDRRPKAVFGSPASFQEPEGVPVQREGLTVETGGDPRAIEENENPN
jgi:hypothetical protein